MAFCLKFRKLTENADDMLILLTKYPATVLQCTVFRLQYT